MLNKAHVALSNSCINIDYHINLVVYVALISELLYCIGESPNAAEHRESQQKTEKTSQQLLQDKQWRWTQILREHNNNRQVRLHRAQRRVTARRSGDSYCFQDLLQGHHLVLACHFRSRKLLKYRAVNCELHELQSTVLTILFVIFVCSYLDLSCCEAAILIN